MSPGGFEFIDAVTSDLTFVARGDTLERLFAAAADALLDATVEGAAALGQAVSLPLALEEPDLELLLLAFLNELVYLRDARGLLLRAGALRVEEGAKARLQGTLVGEPLRPGHHRLRSEVKAATAHGLRVARDAGGTWTATVTLDV
jgi:SHS2 domain-containing protein